ncbi:MAG: Lrp/AsnC family transcriptional regulator, partial [Acidobacteriota bacterium]
LDRAILDCIQKDASLSLAQISERVGLSSTPCWRRIQKLEKAGVIRRRVALLDAQALNLWLTAFVSVRTNQHSQEWLEQFTAVIDSLPEVVEFYRMSGDIDYLLKVVVPDIGAFDAVYKRLIEKVDLLDVSSSFAMERIRSTTALPLHYVATSD